MDGDNADQPLGFADNVVDVLAALLQEHPPNEFAVQGAVGLSFVRRVGQAFSDFAQFLTEAIRSLGSVLSPPPTDSTCVPLRLLREPYLHGSESRSSRTWSKSFSRPARMSPMPRSMDACSRSRSSASSSSPPAAIMTESSAPSGKVVGSSTTMRPFSTCAFSADIPGRYHVSRSGAASPSRRDRGVIPRPSTGAWHGSPTGASTSPTTSLVELVANQEHCYDGPWAR